MDQHHYEHLDRQTTALLTLAASVIGVHLAQEAQHFIDHDEYGLALETIAFGLVDSRAAVTWELRGLVAALAATMGLQDDEYVRAVRNTPAEAHSRRA